MSSPQTKKTLKIALLSGEASGHKHASYLIDALRLYFSHIDFDFYAVTDRTLKSKGVKSILDADDLAVMGILEVFKNYSTISHAMKKIVRFFEIEKPDLVICIDYPGFNLRLIKEAYLRGLKVVYHIPPKIWAHGFSRVSHLEKYCDLVTSILPFEEEVYKKTQVNFKFVGNPIKDDIQTFLENKNSKKTLDIEGQPIIGLLPGSRKMEVYSLLPLMIESFIELTKDFPNAKAIIAVASTLSKNLLQEICLKTLKRVANKHFDFSEKILFTQPSEYYETINSCDYLWVCSGTASLEVTLFKKPFSVCYKMNSLSFFIAYLIVNLTHVSLVNLVSQYPTIPEFLQAQANKENLVSHAKEILQQSQKKKALTSELEKTYQLFPDNSFEKLSKTIMKKIFGIEYGKLS